MVGREPRELQELLRYLTPPIVAVTTSSAGRRNGMIANSAQRASLVPSIPRISLYISKTNYTHDLVFASGLFGIHVLYADQWDVVRRLGFSTGRGRDKLDGLPHRLGETGCPMLEGVRVAFECRVVNTMDAGGSTFFLGDVVSVEAGAPGPIMTSEHFRANASPEDRATYEIRLAATQAKLLPLSRLIDRTPWPGPRTGP